MGFEPLTPIPPTGPDTFDELDPARRAAARGLEPIVSPNNQYLSRDTIVAAVTEGPANTTPIFGTIGNGTPVLAFQSGPAQEQTELVRGVMVLDSQQLANPRDFAFRTNLDDVYASTSTPRELWVQVPYKTPHETIEGLVDRANYGVVPPDNGVKAVFRDDFGSEIGHGSVAPMR